MLIEILWWTTRKAGKLLAAIALHEGSMGQTGQLIADAAERAKIVTRMGGDLVAPVGYTD